MDRLENKQCNLDSSHKRGKNIKAQGEDEYNYSMSQKKYRILGIRGWGQAYLCCHVMNLLGIIIMYISSKIRHG